MVFFIIETHWGHTSKYSVQGMLSISIFALKCSHYFTKTPLPLHPLNPIQMCITFPNWPDCQHRIFSHRWGKCLGQWWTSRLVWRVYWLVALDGKESITHICYRNAYLLHTVFFTNVLTIDKALSARCVLIYVFFKSLISLSNPNVQVKSHYPLYTSRIQNG